MQTDVNISNTFLSLLQKYGTNTTIAMVAGVGLLGGMILQATIGISGLLTICGVYFVMSYFSKKSNKETK